MREYLMRRLEVEVRSLVSFVRAATISADAIDRERLAERIDRLCDTAAALGHVLGLESM